MPSHMPRACYTSAISIPSTPDGMNVDMIGDAGVQVSGYATPTSPNASRSHSGAHSSRVSSQSKSHFASARATNNRVKAISYDGYSSTMYDPPQRSKRHMNAVSIPTPSPSESPSTPLLPLPKSHSITSPHPLSLPSPRSLSASLRLPLPSSFSACNFDSPRVGAAANSTSKPEKKRKHISLNHPSHPRTNPAHIPRPRNAFILFRSYALASGLLSSANSSSPTSANSGSSRSGSRKCTSIKNGAAPASATDQPSLPLQQNEASREIAKIWRGIDSETRAVFEEMAREEKRRHREMYPDYRYAPRKVGGAAVSQGHGQRYDDDEDEMGVGNQRRKSANVSSVAYRKKTQTRNGVASKKTENAKKRRVIAPLTPDTTPEASPSPFSAELNLGPNDGNGDEDESSSESSSESEYEPFLTRRLAGRNVCAKAGLTKKRGRYVTGREEIAAMEKNLQKLNVDDCEDVGGDEGDDEEVLSNLHLPDAQLPEKRPHPDFTLPPHSSIAPSTDFGSTCQNVHHNSPSFNAIAHENVLNATSTNSSGTTQPMPPRPMIIDTAKVPLLASTTYYAPSFIHIDRTRPQIPQDPEPFSSNTDFISDPNPYSESGSASALDSELDSLAYSTLFSSLYDDNVELENVKEQEREQELIRRAVKPFAPLWLPIRFNSSSSYSHLPQQCSYAGFPNVGKNGVDHDSIRAGVEMVDLDMPML